MTRVVVVTVVRGRHEHLRAQQHSLAAGGSPERHVVVAMGDPGIDTVVAAGPLAATSDVVHLAADGPLPLARARNLGARRAFDTHGAGLVVFLDVDCLAGDGLVGGYAGAWRSTATAGPRLLSGPVSYLDPPGPGGYVPDDLAASSPHPARPAPAPGQVARAEDLRLFWSLSFAVDAPTWRQVGGFDESYDGYGAEDTDLGQRATAVGVSLWWAGSARAYHQWHPVSDPPVEHLDDIVRNANRFHARWGWFPMEGWLAAFAERGLARLDGGSGGWTVTR